MKTNFRVVVLLGVGLTSLVLCIGRDGQTANADEIPTVTAEADVTPAQPVPVSPAQPPTSDADKQNAPAPQSAVTNAPPASAEAIRVPGASETVKLSPALEDVIKLVQAGVGEQVLMIYVLNSTNIFNIGPNEIVYLHDLGVSPEIITALIQQDSTPEALARKQAAGAVQPLPPGVALSAPATNIFTPKMASLPPGGPGGPPPGEPTADLTAVNTNAVPEDPNAIPPVVYTVPEVVQQPVNVSYFYNELAPYGSWVDVAGYGYCWRPTVAVWNSAWRPYADCGRWLWTDCGWYWYSGYSWGWAPFHYGRWACPGGVGWVWQPGTTWSAAWVNWQVTPSHCGWAPLGPSHHNHHGIRHSDYVFVAKGNLGGARLRESLVSPSHAARLANDSTHAERGPDFASLPAGARNSMRPVSVRRGTGAGSNGSRREQLDTQRATLTVAHPPAAAPTVVRPPATTRATSSGGQRASVPTSLPSTASPTVTTPAAGSAQPQTASSAPPPKTTGRGPAPIIMRGNGRSATASVSTESRNSVPNPGAVESRAPASPVTPPPNNNSQVRRAPPAGGRAAPTAVARPQTVAVNSSTGPSAAPRPVPAAARPAPVRVVSQPTVQRAPVASVPAPVSVAPSPVVRAAPPGPTVSAPSRVAPSPAPSGARSAPGQVSGGSRSSSSAGGQRGSR